MSIFGVNPDPMLQPQVVSELVLYRMAVITRSTSLPLVRVFEGQFGITRRHWHVLGLLAEHGPLSAKALGQHCWLDAPRISRALSGLIARKLVRREPGSRRPQPLALTDAGLALHARALQWVAAFNADLIGVLNAAERRQFDSMLHRLQARALELSQAVAQRSPPVPRNKGRRA